MADRSECPVCGAPIGENDDICLECGAFLDEVEEGESEEKVKFCPLCGAKVTPEDEVCPICREPIEFEELPAKEEAEQVEEVTEEVEKEVEEIEQEVEEEEAQLPFLERLQMIEGIGAAMAKRIKDQGYDDFVDLASAKADDLMEIDYLNEEKARKVINFARSEFSREVEDRATDFKETAEQMTEVAEEVEDVEEEREESEEVEETMEFIEETQALESNIDTLIQGLKSGEVDEEVAEELENVKEEMENVEKIPDLDDLVDVVEELMSRIDTYYGKLDEKTRIDMDTFEERYSYFMDLVEEGEDKKAFDITPELIRQGGEIVEILVILSEVSRRETKESSDELGEILYKVHSRCEDGNYREARDEAERLPSMMGVSERKGIGLRKDYEKRLSETLELFMKAQRKSTELDLTPIEETVGDSKELAEKGSFEMAIEELEDTTDMLRRAVKAAVVMDQVRDAFEEMKDKEMEITDHKRRIEKANEKAGEGRYKRARLMLAKTLDIMEQELESWEPEEEEKEVVEKVVEKPAEPEVITEVREEAVFSMDKMLGVASSMYSFMFPIYLLIFVVMEAVFVFAAFPELVPSNALLYLSPLPLLGLGPVPSLIGSIVFIGILVLLNYNAIDIVEEKVQVDESSMRYGLWLSLVMLASAGLAPLVLPALFETAVPVMALFVLMGLLCLAEYHLSGRKLY